MKPIGIGAVLMLAAPAWASFDLMMIPNGGRVQRHDPVNNLALGSFNGTSSGVRGVLASNSMGLAYVTGGGVVRAYRYSSGEFVWGQSLNSTHRQMIFSPDESRVASISGNQLTQFNAANGALLGSTSLGANLDWYAGATMGNFTTLIGVSPLGLTTRQYNWVNGTLSSPAQITADVSPVGMSASAFIGTSFRYFVASYIASDGSIRLHRQSLTPDGSFGSFSGNQILSGFSAASVTPAVVAGHNSFFVVGRDSANSSLTRITQFDGSVGAFDVLQSYTVTAAPLTTSGHYQVANVVAPEPATMLALGAGLTALMAKRRRMAAPSEA